MIIAQISDTHILARSSDQPEGAARAENLRRCVADINRQGVDVVVHTGDSVHHGMAEEYVHLREILAELEAPLFLVPGNRDRQGAVVPGPRQSRPAGRVARRVQASLLPAGQR
jgi:3',5'-cyclic AMP phosphodiesterase CpdA